MKQTQFCVLDLTKTEGDGDLSCPKCGNAISPDDCTEEAYTSSKKQRSAIGV